MIFLGNPQIFVNYYQFCEKTTPTHSYYSAFLPSCQPKRQFFALGVKNPAIGGIVVFKKLKLRSTQ
jgi:hypothetical protein